VLSGADALPQPASDKAARHGVARYQAARLNRDTLMCTPRWVTITDSEFVPEAVLIGDRITLTNAPTVLGKVGRGSGKGGGGLGDS
jgi:hypothetical protein